MKLHSRQLAEPTNGGFFMRVHALCVGLGTGSHKFCIFYVIWRTCFQPAFLIGWFFSTIPQGESDTMTAWFILMCGLI